MAPATKLDTPVIMWIVDSLDWKSKNTEAINREIKNTVRNGSIILMHDIHKTTADALPTILRNLKKKATHL